MLFQLPRKNIIGVTILRVEIPQSFAVHFSSKEQGLCVLLHSNTK
jgi:hypothetical protein